MNQSWSELPNTIPSRRFVFSSDASYKFWSIALQERILLVRFGKVGSVGQTRAIEHGGIEAAKKDYLKRIREKQKAGYTERLSPAKKVVSSDDVWQFLEEHEPFLQTILEDPDDEAGYAIYADWLSEREDPLGQFTHLQVQLRNPMLPLFRRAKMEKEAADLQVMHARKWLGSLAPWLMDRRIGYRYAFHSGQLDSIFCPVFDLEFGDELRRSPHCRMLRELTALATQYTDRPIEIDGQRFEANVKTGLESLVGAEFSNLRYLRLGIEENEDASERGSIGSPRLLPDLISTMSRLETLYLLADVRWHDLFRHSLPKLTTLHVSLPAGQISRLIESNWLPQLQTLGFLTQMNDEALEKLVAAPGFDQLMELVIVESRDLTDRGKNLLNQSGVNWSMKKLSPYQME